MFYFLILFIMNAFFIGLFVVIALAVMIFDVCFFKIGQFYSNEDENTKSSLVAYLLARYPNDEKSQQRIKTTFAEIAKEEKRVKFEIKTLQKQLEKVRSSRWQKLLYTKMYRIALRKKLRSSICSRKEELKLLLEIAECWQQFFETLDYYILDEELPELRRNWYCCKLKNQGSSEQEIYRCINDKKFEFPVDF